MDNVIGRLNGSELVAVTRALVAKARGVEAELLAYLAEIDERKLYLEFACPSMHVFCTRELGFSEGGAFNRIQVARAARQFPVIAEALRSGNVHLAGLRLLAPHFTAGNHAELLRKASGRTKREIEELVASISQRPPVPTVIRKMPESRQPQVVKRDAAPMRLMPAERSRAVVAPLAEETFKVQFTATRRLRDKLRVAQDLLRHRVPDGDVAAVLEKALDVLIEQVKKERFAQTEAPREHVPEGGESRHIPNAIKRAVYERDEGRCTFTDARGVRCPETGGLEFDHVDGWARTGTHEVAAIRLLCRAHNQHVADVMYGRAFMERARAGGAVVSGGD